MTPAQLMLRVVGVAFASVVLFALLAVLGGASGTAEAADRPAGLGDLLGGDRPIGNVLAPIVAPVADVVTPILQPPTPAAPTPGPPANVPGCRTSSQSSHRSPDPSSHRSPTPLATSFTRSPTPLATSFTRSSTPSARSLNPVVDRSHRSSNRSGHRVVAGHRDCRSGRRSQRSRRPRRRTRRPRRRTRGPVAAPVTDGVQPASTPSCRRPATPPTRPRATPSVTDGEPAASDETTTVPDLTEEPVVAPVVDEVTIQTAVAAAPGVRSADRPSRRPLVPAALSDAVRDTTDVGASPEASNGRTTSGPPAHPHRLVRSPPARTRRGPAEHRERAALGRHLVALTGRRSRRDARRADRHGGGDVHAVASRHDRLCRGAPRSCSPRSNVLGSHAIGV